MRSILHFAALAAILWGALCALVYQSMYPPRALAQTNWAKEKGQEIVQSELMPAQQFVYAAQVTLPNGDRAGIFAPDRAISLAVQIRSGSRVMVIGDVISCRPFVETEQVGTFKASRQMLNCGPLSRGEPDRILAVVALHWR